MTTSVLCIGELLIDFFCLEVDIDLSEGITFEKQAGGAPANVCATIVKLGGRASFCGKVGDDSFGRFLKNTLKEAGVDTTFLVKDKQVPTTLAFVSRMTGGERDFLFHRGADEQLQRSDVDEQALIQHRMAHFGSATALLTNPFYDTYKACFNAFQQQEAFLSFDPNYRLDLWKGRTDEFIEKCQPFLKQAHLVKVSEEELRLLTNAETVVEGATKLHELGVKWLTVTCGSVGTYISMGDEAQQIPSIQVDSIDSTGAGDAFVGAVLVKLAQLKQSNVLTFAEFKEIVTFANIVGALVCTKIGAISAIPNEQEVQLWQRIKK